MQFRKPQKIAITEGRLTHTIRTWKKPQAKPNGRYNIPPYGAIKVIEVTHTALKTIQPKQLKAAGYSSTDEAAHALSVRPGDLIWSISFEYLGRDEVKRPATTNVTLDEVDALKTKLERMDGNKPWTKEVLNLISNNPGTRAADLAKKMQAPLDTPIFKRQVRRLKALGLTHSLEVGYRLSDRGVQVLDHE